MKIKLVGLLYDRNMGDPLLFDCTKYLLNRIFHGDSEGNLLSSDNITIEYIDLFQRTEFDKKKHIDFNNEPILREGHLSIRNLLGNGVYNFIKDIKNYIQRYRSVQRFSSSLYRQELDIYYKKQFTGSDLVIIIGAGTLKYHVRADFGIYYKSIIEACSDLCIPVVVSCVGIESLYNRFDPRCIRFVKCLNNRYVKYITTRDDLTYLRPYIKRNTLKFNKCADVGVYASQTYNITREIGSKIIGIGIITYKRFVEFARGINKEQYEKIIFEIIKVLEKRKKDWLFFNNGDNEDASYQEYLCKKFGYPISKMMKTPESPRELVVNISKTGGNYVKTALLYCFLFIGYTLCCYIME